MKYIIAILIPMFLTACPFFPLVAATGVGTAGYIATQDRSTGRVIDDTTLWSKLKGHLADDSANRFSHVNVKVNEGRVLLAGHVHALPARIDAVRLAWEVEGVREVINDIKVSHDERNKAAHYSRDTWITTQVKSKLLFAENIKSSNYSIDTVGGVVYIMGIADSKEELAKVTDIARKVDHVKKVVSHIRLKQDFLRRAE